MHHMITTLLNPKGFFFYPVLISVALLLTVLYGVGMSAFLTAALLVVLEITLSFDNAVVNARVLNTMDMVWRKRFLTWGMIIAVFGTRVLLPIMIVAIIAGISPFVIGSMALFDPVHYAELLDHAHHAISAFGAAFLFLVALKYFFDESKEVHWIQSIEQRLSQWGNVEAFEIALVLIILLTVSYIVPAERALVLTAGIVGVVLFILMEGLTHFMGSNSAGVAKTGLGSFLYLNVLDSAFSLDGVIGAFAITTNVLTIAVGLGIGALFVRSLTLYLVEHQTLAKFRYIEHGAHWAIFALAASMAFSLVIEVPEIVTAGLGLLCIGAAYRSSLQEQKTL